MRPGTAVLLLVAGVLLAAVGYAVWPNEERVIRGRLSDVASILSIPAGETELARIERVAHLRDYLAADVRVRFGGQETASLDSVVAALIQWGRVPDAVKVEFVDVQVTLDAARRDAATAYLTARISGRDSVDVRRGEVRLARTAGKWIVTGAETRERLIR